MESTDKADAVAPEIHAAELGRLGSIIKGHLIDRHEALDRRSKGLDVVV